MDYGQDCQLDIFYPFSYFSINGHSISVMAHGDRTCLSTKSLIIISLNALLPLLHLS